jgi:PAS domain S-box-containing protein
MDVVYVPEKDSNGRTRGFYTLVHDITERKALETRLHDSEQRLRAIVDNAGDAIITVDYEGRVQSYNPAAERIFGRSAEEVIGRDARLLLPPSCLECTDFPGCFQVGQCVRGAHRPNDLVGRHKDGRLFPVEITVGEIHDLRLYVALLRDTSERRALERQIIEISTAEQERIGREIHDGIGQQLTALTMLASSAERRLSAAERPEEARIVAGLVSHLQDTLAQTRALARGLAPVEIDPQGLVAALSDLTDYVSRSSGVLCRFVAAEGIEVGEDGLATHLYRIAQEALHNAVRHGAPRAVEVRLDQADRELVLSVHDDGIGIRQTETPTSGLGIHFMRYRAGIIGGELTIETAAEGGTLIRCACPTVR